MEPRPLIDRIADVLRQHVGAEQAITSKEIARTLGMRAKDARRIRYEIENEDWSTREMIVLGIPGSGFFVAEDMDEVITYHIYLRALAAAAARKVREFVGTCKAAGIHLPEKP